jgi:WD40 repeat protein
VRVYDGRTGTFLQSLPHDGVTLAAFAPGGRVLATAGKSYSVRIWRLDLGRLAHEVPTHKANVLDLEFSPQGTYLAGATTTGIAYVWKMEDGTRESAVTAHENYVEGVVFSRDGVALATWDRDGRALVSKTDTGVRVADLDGHAGAVTGAAFGHSRDRLVTSAADGAVRLWNAQARPRLAPLARLREPLAAVDLIRGKLHIRSRGGTLYVVDPATRRVVSVVRHAPLAARSRNGSVTATAHGRTVDVVSGGRRVRLAAGAPVADVAVSRDGRIVAAAAGDDAIMWRVDGHDRRVLKGHHDVVRSVAFSDDGSRLVTAGRDHAVIVWRTADGSPVYAKQPQFGELSDATFSPNRRWIATAGPATVGVLDARNGDVVFLLDGHTDRVKGVSFADDSRRIYSVSLDRTVQTYDCRICGGLPELESLAKRRVDSLERGG